MTPRATARHSRCQVALKVQKSRQADPGHVGRLWRRVWGERQRHTDGKRCAASFPRTLSSSPPPADAVIAWPRRSLRRLHRSTEACTLSLTSTGGVREWESRAQANPLPTGWACAGAGSAWEAHANAHVGTELFTALSPCTAHDEIPASIGPSRSPVSGIGPAGAERGTRVPSRGAAFASGTAYSASSASEASSPASSSGVSGSAPPSSPSVVSSSSVYS